MKRQATQLINEEAPFDISELFFSTTDARGLITSCNDVFVRISGYTSEELLGQPHNIIRHPEMPRCVFFLLWQYLLAGNSIGAYVKNMTKEGRYYWVYALASPKTDGFISIRLKPTSEILSVVKRLYPDLLQIEKGYGNDWRAGMQASYEALLAQISALGFDTYDDFMSASLREEILARESALAGAPDTRIDRALARKVDILYSIFHRMGGLLSLRASLRKKEAFFATLGTHVAKVAVNASVQAAHLAEEGRALGVISEEVSRISRDIDQESGFLRERSSELATCVAEISLGIAQAVLQLQAVDFFQQEQARSDLSVPDQVARYGLTFEKVSEVLASCSTGSLRKAADGITHLGGSLNAFREVSDSLEKILMSIQFSYVTGKTLTARIDAGEQFALLLGDMVSLSESARTQVLELKDAVTRVKADTRQWEQVSTF